MKAGILTQSAELPDSLRNAIDFEVDRFRSFESIRGEGLSLLFIDSDFFEGGESVQFFLSRIRKKLQGIPVMLIAGDSSIDSINSEWFFDDLIMFPFHKGEIKTRVKILVSKNGTSDEKSLISIGKILIDLAEYSVFLNGEKLDFTYKEFELLRLFTQNRGKVFSRKDLLSTIWGVEYIGGTRTVDVHIRRLRCKLGDEFNSLIETVRNVGYRCKE
jgi:DNA-binding response OmpR family regulator